MSRRKGRVPWYRQTGWLIGGILAAAVVVLLLWPRGAVYADYVDGMRPTVVFVWSDPTPHHPHG